MVFDEVGDIGAIECGVLADWDHAVAILLDHGNCSPCEIAPRVRQLGIVALVESLPGEIPITVEWDLAHKKVA